MKATMNAANARRSASRDANLRRLVAELQTQPLNRDDIQSLFDCSATQVRNYIGAMGDLIKQISRGGRAQHTYQITGNQKRIAAFLATLAEPVEPKAPKAKRAEPLPDPSRHFHLLADDTPFRIKVYRGAPVHPPVHAAFWARRAAA